MAGSKVFFIGIVEENGEKTIDYIQKLLVEEEWEVIYENKNKDILVVAKEEVISFLITIYPENLDLYYQLSFNFHVLIYNCAITFDSKYLQCDYFVLNTDDENWLKLPLDKLNPLVISYGFNNKASLTVSSYSDGLSLSLYLQREITSITGDLIEPFEFTIGVKTINEDEINKILIAATTSLILGNKKSNLNIKI